MSEQDGSVSGAMSDQRKALQVMIRQAPEKASKLFPERTVYTVALKWADGVGKQAYFAIDEERYKLAVESGADVASREELVLTTVASSIEQMFEVRRREAESGRLRL